MAGLTLTRQKSDKDQLVAAPPAVELARVNLLPPEIEEAAKFRSLRLVLAAVVAGALVIVILLTIWAGSGIASAQDAVAQQQAQQVALQKQLATLANVPATFAKVASAQNSVSSALGAEVLWSTYLADLSLTIPDGVSMQTMTITQTLPASSSVGVSSASNNVPTVLGPVGTGGIATITFSGQAVDHGHVADFLDSLAKTINYADPYFSVATQVLDSRSGQVLDQFTATVTVTPKAYSNRYTIGKVATP
jgi:Tfp pilus assembly protein PilN